MRAVCPPRLMYRIRTEVMAAVEESVERAS